MRILITIAAALALAGSDALAQEQPVRRTADDNFLFDSMFLEAMQAKLSGDYNTAFDLLKSCRTLNPKSAAVLYEAATLLASSGNFEYAAQYAQEAVKIDTTRNDSYVGLALQCLVKTNKVDETLPLYDTLIVRRPADADANRLMKVAVLQTLNRYDEALDELDRVGKDDLPTLIQAQVQRSLVYGQMGKKKKQAKILKTLAAKYPDNVQVNFQVSHYYFGEGDYDRAIEYCQRACDLPGGDPYLFLLADIYAKQKMDSLFAQASLRAFKSPDIDVSAKLGRLYDAVNRPDQQVTTANWRPFYDNVFYSLLKLYPDDPNVVELTHSYFNSTDRKAKAQSLITGFVDRNEGTDYMWRNILYYVQVEEANYTDSLAYYARRAVMSDPVNPFYHLILGQALQMMDNWSGSLTEYQAAYATYDAARNDDDANNRTFALHGMAQCYVQLDSITQAFAVYDQILSENPSDPVALNNYAYRLAVLGRDLSRAEKMSQKSLNAEPLNPTYLDTYAYILFRLGRNTEALFVMERCVDQYKDGINAEVLDHYGDILKANGHADKALEQWQKALEADPDNANIKRKVDEARRK